MRITDAVPAFIAAQNAALENEWNKIEGHLRSIFPSAAALNLKGQVKMEYLGAVISLESQAIDNIYQKERDTILGFVVDVLEAVEETKRLADAFRAYRAAWLNSVASGNRPWDEVAATFIERSSLPFDKTQVGKIRMMSPMQIMEIGHLLIHTTAVWWKPFSKDNKLKI